ncbi:MAG TPA: ABC transporter permease, partial [Blastocatellia bacterium]
MQSLIQDIRYGARLILRNPGFTAIVLTVLALGIGANAAIFSVVNKVLLAPLPFRDSGRLVMVWGKAPIADADIDPISPGNFADIQAQNRVFESMGASTDILFTLTGEGDPEQIVGYQFSQNFFDVLGTKPLIGRTFATDEDRPGNDHVVVLSYPLWQRQFGGDPAVVGKLITLSGTPYTVIGVMPQGFQHPQMAELWVPLALDPTTLSRRDIKFIRIVARLRLGVTFKQAQTEMNSIAGSLAAAYPEMNPNFGIKLVPMKDTYVGDISPALLTLLAAVGVLLLIACVNIANLLLARATARQKEVALRRALGAGRLRLIRQFLTESVLLSLAGGLVGLGIAFLCSKPMVTMFPNSIANLNIPTVNDIPIDARVILFTLAIALLTSIAFGVAPALQSARVNLNEVLKETGSASLGSPRGRQLRSALVVSEVALALVLLIGAGLLIKSFARLQESRFGFNPENVTALELFLPGYKYKTKEARVQFVENSLDRIRAIPGVVDAGATNFLPLTGFWHTTPFEVDGGEQYAAGQWPEADERTATPGYFRTMGIQILSGRDFTGEDTARSPHVVIVNMKLADRYLAGENPIGRRLNLGDEKTPDWWQIVGIAGDVKAFGQDKETHLDIYSPLDQNPFPLVSLAVKSSKSGLNIARDVRSAVWSVDPDLGIFKLVSMDELANESATLRRVTMLLLGIFALLALVLASVGLYGVVSYSVTQRTREIGIRMALGAGSREVRLMVLKQGLVPVLIGAGIGIVAAGMAARLASTLLFGVNAWDKSIFLGVPILLLGVATLATL